MPVMNFENLADIGVMVDVSEYDLPVNAWSDCQNMRFDDGKCTKYRGHEEVFASPTATPYYAIQMPVGASLYWFYNSLDDLYIWDGSNHTNVTPSGLSASMGATEQINWTGGVLGGGVVVMNNGVQQPLMWSGSSGTDQYSDLSNWPAGQIARVLRPFKQFLVAADIDEGSGRVGNQIMTSSPAAPGAVPGTWDYTDTTNRARTTTLAQGGDYIIDMLPLRDINMIYKDRSVWTQEFIGGNNVFRYRRAFDEGLLSRRCAIDFFGRHLCVLNGDVMIHDGLRAEQPFERRMIRQLFLEMDGTYYYTTFVAANYDRDEVWICYPTAGSTLPNKAMIWNWRDNTTQYKWLLDDSGAGKVPHIAWGIVDTNAGGTIEETTGTYSTQVGTFDEQAYSGALLSMLVCDTSKKLHRTERGETHDGTLMTAYLERTALPLGMQSSKGVSYEPMRYKFIREIWPVIEGDVGEVVTIKVGYRNSQSDAVTWTDYRFTIGTDEHIKTRVAGRIIDIRFTTTGDFTWSLIRYSVVYELGGER